MSFSFTRPSIHRVSDIKATAANFSGGAFLELAIINAAGEEVTLPVFFNPEAAGRAHDIAAAINSVSAKRVALMEEV